MKKRRYAVFFNSCDILREKMKNMTLRCKAIELHKISYLQADEILFVMKNSCREVFLSETQIDFLAIVLKEISVVFNKKTILDIKFYKFLFKKKNSSGFAS